jgi:hypothetical protein
MESQAVSNWPVCDIQPLDLYFSDLEDQEQQTSLFFLFDPYSRLVISVSLQCESPQYETGDMAPEGGEQDEH